MDIDLKQFQEAQAIIKGCVLYSPLIPFAAGSSHQGNSILLKAENLQPSGSFKIRGATYATRKIPPELLSNGVVTYSTGNHAQAVALAAKRKGLKAIIVMSPDAPKNKITLTRNLGAEIVMTESSSAVRKKVAQELALSKGYYIIDPYDHPDVIIGQGTIGLEILEQTDAAAVFVPVGGGGLIAGIAAAIKKKRPEIKIIGVEPEWENDAYHSFRAGKIIPLAASSDSIADAIKILALGEMTFPLIQKYVDDMVTVSEDQIAQATLKIVETTHLFVEPSGALGLAAALNYKEKLPKNKPIICVASGGNTTLDFLYKLQKRVV